MQAQSRRSSVLYAAGNENGDGIKAAESNDLSADDIVTTDGALIVTGGAAGRVFAADFLRGRRYRFVLAVDGGLELCHDIGLMPTHLVGDFDTVEEGLLNRYAGLPGVETIRHRPEKDETDTELAIDLCVTLQAAQIHILGGTGTRMDHTLANVYVLLHAHWNQIPCMMYDSHNKIYLTDADVSISKAGQYGHYVSLLPVTEQVEGVTLKGFKYPLSGAVLRIGYSLGVSNEIEADVGSIHCERGILLVIEAKD